VSQDNVVAAVRTRKILGKSGKKSKTRGRRCRGQGTVKKMQALTEAGLEGGLTGELRVEKCDAMVYGTGRRSA